MKPRFALDLSHDGIGLLHRAKRGWNLVGEASLDDPSLKETLQMLRDTASALEAGGVRSKLIIPDSQILYKTLPAGPESDTRTEAQIRAQLHGATPYDVDDLAFDWARQGNTLHLAVVARETLDEAEAFAAEHRFNPVSFVARPDADQFPGEPFFGATGAAEALISGDDPLERDDFPVAIIGRTALPDPTPEPPPPAPKAAKAAAPADLATPPVTAAAEIVADTPAPDMPAPAPSVPAPPAIAPVEVPAELATLPLPTDPVAADADLAQTMFATARSGAPAVGAPNPAPRLPEGRLGMLDVLADKSARLQALEAGEGITAPSSPIADAASEPPPPASEPSPPAHEPSTPAPKVASARPVSAPSPDTQTVFGAPATGAPIGSRPKALGWVLAAILVLIVAAAALWAVLGTGTATVDAPVDTPQSLAAAPVAPQTPTLPSETAGHAGAGALPAASADSTEPTLAALPQEAPAPTRIATPPRMAPSLPLTPARAQSILDQVGAWVVTPAPPAPPAQADEAAIELAALDPARVTGVPVALPALPPRADAPFAAPAADAPAPVTPTAEGAVSPDGVRIFAGRPPYAVTPRPVAPEATPAEPVALEDRNAHLAQLRPRARAVPETATAEVTEQPPAPETPAQPGNLGGLNWAELQQYRPQPRPGGIAPETSPAPEPAAEPDAPVVAGPVSRLALATSPAPVARPRDFSNAVARALKQAQPEVPIAKAVPAAAALTPSRPTTKSVAQQATEANAIRLNRMNLIGVYGASNERRALVRLPSGRYLKLKIGDRLDGGKVAAITDRELRYVKGGRNIVLSMPKG